METNAPVLEFPDMPTTPCYMPPASVRRMFEESTIAEAIEKIERSQRGALMRGVVAMLAMIW